MRLNALECDGTREPILHLIDSQRVSVLDQVLTETMRTHSYTADVDGTADAAPREVMRVAGILLQSQVRIDRCLNVLKERSSGYLVFLFLLRETVEYQIGAFVGIATHGEDVQAAKILAIDG